MTHIIPTLGNSVIPSCIISNYTALNSIEFRAAQELASELSKFLYIASISPDPLSPSIPVDDMWHEFMLYPVSYENYCRRNFGKIINHNKHTRITANLHEFYAHSKRMITAHFGAPNEKLWPGTGAICDTDR